MRQTKKNPKKRKPEHSPVKPKKQVKSSNQELPGSQEKLKSEGIADTPSLKFLNQESSSSFQENLVSGGNPDQSFQNKETKQKKLVPILQIVNGDFIYKPYNQNPYDHLIQMAATPYDFNLENSQWISPQIIRYRPLNVKSYVFVGKKQAQPQLQLEAKIYLQKSEKMNKKLNQFLKKMTYSYFNIDFFFRGPSGIGKSYAMIQWVLENRKRDDMRIMHIILDDDYLENPSLYFAHDFIYCFYKDLNNEDFPDPPKDVNFIDDPSIQKGEKWFKFLWNQEGEINLFLDLIFEKYLRKKRIAFILFWDDDKIFQKNEQKPFLASIRDYGRFNFKLILASYTNESLNETNHAIEENVGFSKEESKEYLDNTLEKMYGKELKMENKLFEELYQITNGNGYYLSQFVYNEEVTNNYQEKFNKFTTIMKHYLAVQMSQFFNDMFINDKQIWLQEFPQLLLYLDCDKSFLEELIPNTDRNFTYFKDLKLKSVNPLAKEIFVNFYQEKIKEWKEHSNFLALLKSEQSLNNSTLNGILYERYVIQKFLEEGDYEYILPEEEKPRKKIKGKKEKHYINCQTSKILATFGDEEILDYINRERFCLIKPAKFNNLVFDFIIWDGTTMKKCLYVFQVTINENHSPSDKAFFTEEKYKFLRELKDVQVRFIWITNKPDFRSKFEGREIGYLNIMF